MLDALTSRDSVNPCSEPARSIALHDLVATGCARRKVRATLGRLGATRPRLRAGSSRVARGLYRLKRGQDCELERERAHACKLVQAREPSITKYH